MAAVLKLDQDLQATIMAVVFEDTKGAYYLATNHRLTNRTKYFHVKWHWFWYHFKVLRDFQISSIESENQAADYFTKGLPRDAFERNRLKVQGW